MASKSRRPTIVDPAAECRTHDGWGFGYGCALAGCGVHLNVSKSDPSCSGEAANGARGDGLGPGG